MLPTPDRPAPVGMRAAATAAGVAVVGAILLWGTFHTTRGEAPFWIVGYALAAVWIVGAFVVGGVRQGRTSVAPLGAAAAVGVAAFAVVFLAYRLLRDVALIGGALDRIVGTADAAHVAPVLLLAVVNAVAEELFFRGAVGSLLARGDPRRFVVGTTAAYAVVTVASLNVALVLAAIGMGALFAVVAWTAGGVVAPAACHVTWSVLMLLAVHR